MAIALNAPMREASNKPYRSRATWLMMAGFLVYTLLILIGHIIGFPLGYAFLHTVCSNGCGLTPENVHALASHGFSIDIYANLYMSIQLIYILVSVGVGLLIVFKKPGQWVPLGVSCFLIGFSAYEGVNYPALAAAYPALDVPSQALIGVGMGIVGMYALLTFPNGKFGSRWVLGYFIFQIVQGVLALFITNPDFVEFNNILGTLSFPLILGILIYRYRRLLNAREQAAIKWLIVSWSVFMLTLILYAIILAATPTNSLTFLLANTIGFFGCGINIAGFLMAVLYANAFDIDVFVRRTLVYTLLTAILAMLYAGLVLGSHFVLATFSPQASQSPVILVGSTLVIAALFQPLRHRLQRAIDRRFYRQKYDARRIIEDFSANLRNEIDLAELSEQLVEVVQETMQPTHTSLWLRKPDRTKKPAR
ncbi:MAG TPA: hypothetical protein VJO32_00235 [Ktedonobacteraceae bacterium]|nr:hypothetical protein [Ktedonobacteraceae bacterium]